MSTSRPLRILSLDGGGVKGIASLYMLNTIMKQVQLKLRPESRQKRIRPCDYFDLICGTSTGGLIALLLGRLRYTVEEAIEIYLKLAEEIFSKMSNEADAEFDHTILERSIKDAIRYAPAPEPNTLHAEELLEDPSIGHPQGGTRTFVVSIVTRGAGSTPTRMTTYSTEEDPAFKAKIWQAGRATSAAPTYFTPIIIDHVSYGDGGTIANNPTEEAMNEAKNIWGDRPIGCLVSIGVGLEDPLQLVKGAEIPASGVIGRFVRYVSPKNAFKLKVAEWCAKCLTSCERVHQRIARNIDHEGLRGRYFRLNVPLGIGGIGLEEWMKINDIIALTTDYMNGAEGRFLRRSISAILADPQAARNLSNEGTVAEWNTILGYRYAEDAQRTVNDRSDPYTIEEPKDEAGHTLPAISQQSTLEYIQTRDASDTGSLVWKSNYPALSEMMSSMSVRYSVVQQSFQRLEKFKDVAPEFQSLSISFNIQQVIFTIQGDRIREFAPRDYDNRASTTLSESPGPEFLDQFCALYGGSDELYAIFTKTKCVLSYIESDCKYLHFFIQHQDMKQHKIKERFGTLLKNRRISMKISRLRKVNAELVSLANRPQFVLSCLLRWRESWKRRENMTS